MDLALPIALAALVVGLAAGAAAASALSRSRSREAAISEAGADATRAAAHVEVIQVQVAALQESERTLSAAHQAAEQRADRLEAQLGEVAAVHAQLASRTQELLTRQAQLGSRLLEQESRLRESLEVTVPPPIPSGRSVAKLDDLRAALRAQATEAALEAEGGRAQ